MARRRFDFDCLTSLARGTLPFVVAVAPEGTTDAGSHSAVSGTLVW